MEKTTEILRQSVIISSVLALASFATACGGSSGGERPGASGGTSGAGGATVTPAGAGGAMTGSGGVTTGSGGATTAGGSTGTTGQLSCTPGVSPANPLITDFSATGWNETAGKFGTPGNLTGSIFGYGGGQTGSTMQSSVDTVGKDLVLSGSVLPGDYSGGGMSFDQCVNTSTYTGVQFTLGGTTAGCDLYLKIQTFDEQPTANRGGCTTNCYSFPSSPKLTSTSGVVTVHFADLTGGEPTTPAAIKTEMVGLQWQFQSPAPVGDAGQPGCTGINLTITNVSFVSN